MSGQGKTTLVRRFLSHIAAGSEAVVLDGRCYERESVPFKAFDDLVDALGRFLRRLRPLEAASYMPRDVPALLRLFPALGRLELLARQKGRPVSEDAQELRRRALVARIAVVSVRFIWSFWRHQKILFDPVDLGGS